MAHVQFPVVYSNYLKTSILSLNRKQKTAILKFHAAHYRLQAHLYGMKVTQTGHANMIRVLLKTYCKRASLSMMWELKPGCSNWVTGNRSEAIWNSWLPSTDVWVLGGDSWLNRWEQRTYRGKYLDSFFFFWGGGGDSWLNRWAQRMCQRKCLDSWGRLLV